VRNDQSTENVAKVESVLNDALRHVIQDLPDNVTQQRAHQRERIGRALIVMAGLCLVIASLPWPSDLNILRPIFFGVSVVALFASGWQLDKASKEEEAASRKPEQFQPIRWRAGRLRKTWLP
jgi:hypothetical protein